MASHVEVNDVNLARAAAQAVTAAGAQCRASTATPPEPVWGDDEFGARMRAKYPADTAEACERRKRELAVELSALGHNVSASMDGYLGRDQDAARELDRI